MTDIVNTLRQRHHNVTGGNPLIEPIEGPTIFSEAADTIERLCAERDEARRQRDQARRTLCKVLVMTRPPNSMQSMRGFAKEMGWDCFPQEDEPCQ
jgi:hypothetical protein